MRNLPRCRGQLQSKKNLDDLKDEITTDNVPTRDGQWMGDPKLRSHEESTKRAQRGLKEGSKMAYTRGDRVLLSIDSDVSRFVVKILLPQYVTENSFPVYVGILRSSSRVCIQHLVRLQ